MKTLKFITPFFLILVYLSQAPLSYADSLPKWVKKYAKQLYGHPVKRPLRVIENCQYEGSDALEMPGPYTPVYVENVSIPNISNPDDGPITAAIYAPGVPGGEGQYQPPAEGEKYGVSVMLPPYLGDVDTLRCYSQHLASHGYVVTSITFTNNDLLPDGMHDVIVFNAVDTITYMLADSSIATDLNDQQITSIGYSRGGKIAVYHAAEDDRVNMVLSMDPYNTSGGPCALFPSECNRVPVWPVPYENPVYPEFVVENTPSEGILAQIKPGTYLFNLRASGEESGTQENPIMESFYLWNGASGNDAEGMPYDFAGITAPALYYNFELLAAHADWTDDPLGMGGDPDVKRVTRRSFVAAMRYVYDNDTTMEEYLTGAIIQADIDSGVLVSVEQKDFISP